MPTAITETRPFYTRAWLYLLLVMVVIVAGFVPSFFTQLGNTDLWHHLHGITATAWLSLLVVQPFLYSRGRLNIHRRLGKLSYVLVPLLTIGGIKMIALMIQRRNEYPPLEAYRLSFIDTVSLIFFIYFFIQAIRNVRTTGLHARYLAATSILLVPPGLARLLFNLFPGIITGFTINLHICFVVLELAVLLLLLDDKRRDGKLSLPYLVLAAVLIVLHLSLPFASQWVWWQKLMVGIFG
jgi:hypothetical protein